jgi:hypothetical protein
LFLSGTGATGRHWINPLAFDRVFLRNGNGMAMAPGNTPAGGVAIQGSTVPEPASVLLFLVPALSGFGILRRRRRQ